MKAKETNIYFKIYIITKKRKFAVLNYYIREKEYRNEMIEFNFI